jgi:hypothetical protein
MRRAAKTDANQTAIVGRLRACGVFVEVIGKPVDLLVWHRGVPSLMEVKNRDGKNQLTKEQVEFIARYPGDVHIVHDEGEALLAVLGKEVLA